MYHFDLKVKIKCYFQIIKVKGLKITFLSNNMFDRNNILFINPINLSKEIEDKFRCACLQQAHVKYLCKNSEFRPESFNNIRHPS